MSTESLNIFFIIVRRRKAEDTEEVNRVEEVVTVVVAEAVEAVEAVVMVELVEVLENVENMEAIEAVMVMSKEEDLSKPSFCGIGGKEPYISVINDWWKQARLFWCSV